MISVQLADGPTARKLGLKQTQPLKTDIEAIDAIMRGAPPLVLFLTIARDRRLFFKFFNSGLLDRGNLTIRDREIVIDRVTASCGAEYEWGVHVSVYGDKAGLTEAQIASLVNVGPTTTAGSTRIVSSSGCATACSGTARSTTRSGLNWPPITATRRSWSCSCWRAPTGP